MSFPPQHVTLTEVRYPHALVDSGRFTNRKHRKVIVRLWAPVDADYEAVRMWVENPAGIKFAVKMDLTGTPIDSAAFDPDKGHFLDLYPRRLYKAGQVIEIQAQLSPEVHLGRRRPLFWFAIQGAKIFTVPATRRILPE